MLGLLVVPARHVIGEDPTRPAGHVVSGEQRYHGQALHGHGQVFPDHLTQLVRLPLQAQDHSLDLLVVLELGLEQPHHLDGGAGRPGNGDGGIAVGREHLLHGPVGDDVTFGGPPVAGHDDAVPVAQGDHRGAVPDVADGGRRRTRRHGGRWRGRDGQTPDEAGEVRSRVIGGRKEGQGHLGYSPPFWT